ncbi:hypothetical protein OG455_10125 [Kitasatospora sp. NBC_01287]|uniref:hypothetical protein n=1 Tax=Kitasatospora sp. NBC_01287 TaxID=2903573 RepID=UPI002250825D|nr:hypothetical protein [Kitasatospora sp. NBC_01287]MCX4745878.1 hypothetical protein [Kitasatospora sp. NBC_01287]
MDNGEIEDIDTLVRTRRALHAVAELVLAGPQYRTSGTIRLRAALGGFATRAEPNLQVVGADLVAPGQRLFLERTTCAALADAVGVEAGPPAGLYQDGCGLGPEDVIEAEPGAAHRIAQGFVVGDAALRRLLPGADPVIWPEHFDLGVTEAAVNYGVSPGDDFLAEPYAYVGPHTRRSGEYWNAPFGAAVAVRELGGVDGVLAFFEQGRRLAG